MKIFKRRYEAKKQLDDIKTRYEEAIVSEEELLLKKLNTTERGLKKENIIYSRIKYGDNVITKGKKANFIDKIKDSFVNPFTIILLVLAVVSFFTDVIIAKPGESNPATVIIITVMVIISGGLRFIQETKSGNAAKKLLEMITTTIKVERIDTGIKEIPIDSIVVGDIVYLSAGDMIPADIRILSAKDLFISQSTLTGESEPVEKTGDYFDISHDSVMECPNLAFMGSNVVSGSAKGVVIVTGNETIFGEIAKSINEKPIETSFEKGVNSVSWLLIRFMLIMVPIVLLINGFTKGDWLQAILFAISIAVGLTPEMLPMIVTASLSKGAITMAKEKTIIKNLNSIQNLGSIDILCTDKTGTLTQDKVALQDHFNIHGKTDSRVLKYGFLNSYYQTGLKNLIDIAIIEHKKEEEDRDELKDLEEKYTKIDELPFDFERRRMSVVVEKNGETEMITKGAVEEIISICSFAEFDGEVVLLDEKVKEYIIKKIDTLNNKGMRVIAVARKENPPSVDLLSIKDESDMTLIGYLAFLDPPKPSASKAIKALKEFGVEVKVLTGDNDKVADNVCRQVGINADRIMLGTDIDKIEGNELEEVVERVDVFAKLSPHQKSRIIDVLREKGHSVGYMGDGINDVAAMKASDVGISVDTAVDITKESADIILLEKDLMILEKAIIEGRKTYANMIKYIKMTASSNFGNMFSVLIASAFLPFLPMMSIQLLLLNLIYDISCIAIPWDNVDLEYINKPRKWEASSIGKFMIWIGPISSIFDITTYLLMYFIICPMAFGGNIYSQLVDPAQKIAYIALFQAGWFVESMWSQTLVIHMIRTPKIPFIQSRASASVTILTFLGIVILTIIPFTSFGFEIGLAPLPKVYFIWLLLTIFMYMATVTAFKKIFINRYGELL